eukprot:GHRR01010166.1.p1 GENE.GHRR01010166.1~~GHRR01010166.1.p1  ORF type:complete len:336 (+),score=105.56 GHRR01010166.1:396-1403(+)
MVASGQLLNQQRQVSADLEVLQGLAGTSSTYLGSASNMQQGQQQVLDAGMLLNGGNTLSATAILNAGNDMLQAMQQVQLLDPSSQLSLVAGALDPNGMSGVHPLHPGGMSPPQNPGDIDCLTRGQLVIPGGISPRGRSPRGGSPGGGSPRGLSPGGSPRNPVTYVGPNAAVQSYCKQEISLELNTAVTTLLTTVKGFQDRAMAKNPVKANMRRWYVCGLREVRKAIKSGKAKAVLLAPNIEQVEAEGGLNDSVEDILSLCRVDKVPVVFALSRKKMGEVYGFRKRMSAIALLDVNGIQELFNQVSQLAEEGRQKWAVNHSEGAATETVAAGARRG